MKVLFGLILSVFAVSAFAGEEPTLAEPQSVVVKESCCCDSSDCRIRRKGLFGRRGYVVVRHTVSDGCCSTTREVVDRCCNTVRSVTKTTCSCGSTCGCK